MARHKRTLRFIHRILEESDRPLTADAIRDLMALMQHGYKGTASSTPSTRVIAQLLCRKQFEKVDTLPCRTGLYTLATEESS